MKRLISILFAILNIVFVADAERYYYFEHLRASDGLPSNTIYCSLQDRHGFMWIGTRDGLSRYDGQTFVRLEDLAPELPKSGYIKAVKEGGDGRIWFISSSIVGYYDPMTDKADTLGYFSNLRCNDIAVDNGGDVWIASEEVIRYDTATETVQSYSVGNARPSKISVDSMGTVWVMLHDGTLYTYDASRERFNFQSIGYRVKNLRAAEDSKMLVATRDNDVFLIDCITLDETLIFSSKGRTVNCIIEARKDEFWIGTDFGLFIRKNGEAYKGKAFHDDATPNSISANYITCIDKDNTGDLWIGTFYTGLNIWRDRTEEMDVYFNNPSRNSAKGKIVRSICSDDKGGIWFCTEDGYLNHLNTQTQEISNFVITPGLNMQKLVKDGDNLWICTYGDGLYLFDTVKGKVERHYDFPVNTLNSGIKTAEDDIFIGTTRGLYILNRDLDRFTHIPATGKNHIHCLYQDSSGIIWAGTYGNGILCLDRSGKVLVRLPQDNQDSGLTSKFITSFFEDSKHRMWVTTEGGGICHTVENFNIENLHFRSIGREEGLPSDITCSVTEDNHGAILVSTTNGIAYLSGEDTKVAGLVNDSNYEVAGYQYSYGAVHMIENGMTYFGNTDGMIALMPSKTRISGLSYPICITSIQASNSERTEKLSEQGKSAMNTKDIRVKRKDASVVSISFVVPSYTNKNILYNYTISKGKNEIFSGTTDKNEVTFAGLDAGKYRFTVAVEGTEDENLKKSLGIVIVPHPLLSRLAYIIYSILIVLLIMIIFWTYDQANKKEKDLIISTINNNKERELYKAKINFFTNITHEIRTPLTLIKMPLDKIISKGAVTPDTEKEIHIIMESTERLLNLTNQLLDMRKMNQIETQLSCTKEDICKIVRKVCGYFEQAIQELHISLILDIPETPVYLMCAKDSVTSIVNNLISNAVRYGKDRIEVRLSEEGETVILRVDSNGEIIPASDGEKIFSIFYQRETNIVNGKISQGTGLGLPYARILANMHNGKLFLDTEVQGMNSFVLELPAGVEEDEVKTFVEGEDLEIKEIAEYNSSRHTILIVEDATLMGEYLGGELSDTYNVIIAANGAEALDIMRTSKVDLVISDIMMPVMDGCELCNIIKTDSDFSHIPVILFTAAVGVETHIESLDTGADGYIEKPFPIELLRSNIANLFKNKEISYQQFINKPLTHYNNVTVSKVDEEYMEKLHDFIMTHIAEADLNIENLTTQLGTSKSSLYRKLKANTGLSINEYIRVCRLKQAAELLSSQKYKINEVAFMTGFSSPSYFATCFQKQFNLSPSEFVKGLGQ